MNRQTRASSEFEIFALTAGGVVETGRIRSARGSSGPLQDVSEAAYPPKTELNSCRDEDETGQLLQQSAKHPDR